MQGITSLEGHDRANKRMRNSLRMVIPQLSEDQKEKIMQDIMETVSPRAEPAMRDNINIGGQQFDMDQLKQMPMQAGQVWLTWGRVVIPNLRTWIPKP